MSQIFIPSFNPALTILGQQAAAAKMAFYETGTTTLATVYDENGDPLDQSENAYGTVGVAADITGRFPQIYLGDEVAYRVVLRTAQGAQIGNEADPYTNIEQLIRSLLAAPTGAGLIGFSHAASYPAGTLGAKDQQYISVKDAPFNAKLDGVTDDTAAIQAALDMYKPTSISADGLPNKSYAILIPSGTALISARLKVYSGTTLFGMGAASTLKAAPSLTDRIIDLQATVNNQCRWVTISKLNFETTGTCRAIKSSTGLFLNSTIKDCTFNASFCVDLTPATTYTQSVVLENLTSVGPLDQLIAIKGNCNQLKNITKEGQTGTSSDSYIYAISCSQLYMERILLEGAGSANKTPIKLVTCSVTMQQVWFEGNATNGYALDIDSNSEVWIYNGIQYIDSTLRKIKVSNGSRVFIDRYDDSSTASELPYTLEINDTSSVVIDEYRGRTFGDIYQISKLITNLKINRAVSTSGIPANGYNLNNSIKYIGGNLLQNPSFEAGMYGWSTTGTGLTPAVEASEVSTGLMVRITAPSATNATITQAITIAAAQVGIPFTFTGMVKAVAGTAGNCWGSVNATGAGLVTGGSNGFISRARLGQGWQIVSQTFTPLAAGTLLIGFIFFGVTELCVDNAYFGYGVDGEPDRSKFGAIDLAQKTFTCATAAPTTGTWKVGDRVFNSVPVVGQPKSWACTVAGTPGTWVSEGNL